MPRPRFIPTTTQRRTLTALAKAQREHARKRAAADREFDQVIARAVAEEIPVSVIADELGWTRQRVYRHAGQAGE